MKLETKCVEDIFLYWFSQSVCMDLYSFLFIWFQLEHYQTNIKMVWETLTNSHQRERKIWSCSHFISSQYSVFLSSGYNTTYTLLSDNGLLEILSLSILKRRDLPVLEHLLEDRKEEDPRDNINLPEDEKMQKFKRVVVGIFVKPQYLTLIF